MNEPSKNRLNEFRIPLMNHNPYFGVFMACHSIPDAILVLHKGTGCKMKGATHIPDVFHESFSQVCWTEVLGVDILTDSHVMIEDTVLTSYERRRPGVIAVATSSVIEMTGFDMRETVEALQPKVGCPLIYVPTSGYEGDMYDGMADFAMSLAGYVDWSRPPEPGAVNIFGYPFERYEMDHGANIRELRGMIEAIGLHPGSWFFSGQKAAKLLAAHEGELNVALPYFRKRAEELEKVSGRPTLVQNLPMGILGTTRWLEDVAKAAGADMDKTAAFTKGETERVKLLIDISKRCLGERRVCIIQPTPLAAGCAAIALEMELEITNVVLLDYSLGGREEFLTELSRLTTKDIPDNLNILENPSWAEISVFPEFSNDEKRHVKAIIITPGVEMPPVQKYSMRLRLELGSPSHSKHLVYPAPYLGYDGTVALAQRIMNASTFRF